MKIVVHEEKPNELHVVLPLKPGADLSDTELEGVTADAGHHWHGKGGLRPIYLLRRKKEIEEMFNAKILICHHFSSP
jgi:hypothetical protein